MLCDGQAPRRPASRRVNCRAEGERIRDGERNLDKLTDEARINLMFLQTEPIKPGLQSQNGAVALVVRAGWFGAQLRCVSTARDVVLSVGIIRKLL